MPFAMQQLREMLTKYSAPAIVGAIALLGACVLFLAWWLRRPAYEPIRYQAMTYFYDMNTKELFVVPNGTLPPIETDSGPHNGMPAGVMARVFCCGQYQAGDEYIIGKLEVPAAAVPEDQRPKNWKFNPDTGLGGVLIRRPDDRKWIVEGSRQAQKLMQELRKQCPRDKPLRAVEPIPQRK